MSHDATSPSLIDRLWFRTRVTGLQLRQALRHEPEVQRHQPAENQSWPVVAESRTPLWTEQHASERALTLGKIHNLRLALRQIHGVLVPAGQVFSFWKQMGRLTRAKGYTIGRELREGCLVPTVGGGICQLSNALYDAALKADLIIVERHGHTQVIPGSLAEVHRDATVFWNYVDLRFAAAYDFQIAAELSSDTLTVRIVAPQIARRQPLAMPSIPQNRNDHTLESCYSCNETQCSQHVTPAQRTSGSKEITAYVVDGVTPEFAAFLRKDRTESDHLYLPLDGRQWKRPSYAWPTDGFAEVHSLPWFTMRRSWQSRKVQDQGAARQKLNLNMARSLAHKFARRLPPNATRLVVSQSIAMSLLEHGEFGGRQIEILADRLPLKLLQARLDAFAAQYPESHTLSDFRVAERLESLDTACLERAHRLITPHSELQALFGAKASALSWAVPDTIADQRGQPANTIGFPASTLGRKGAYQVREVAAKLGLRVRLFGRVLESDDFWKGVDIEWAETNDGLAGLACVVLPSVFEARPSRLLKALSLGVQVIASPGCGLAKLPNVIECDPLDQAALTGYVSQTMSPEPARLSG